MCNLQPNNANIFHRLQVGKIEARKSTATLGFAFAKLSSSSELKFARSLKGTMIKFVWLSLLSKIFTYSDEKTIKNNKCIR